MEDKVKIRRSNGRTEFVTREELEQLNLERKQRDQARGADSTKNLLLPTVVACWLLIALVAVVIFVM